MQNQFAPFIAVSLSLPKSQVLATICLLQAGGTIPFISRYRKEQTGGLDEVQIAAVEREFKSFQALYKRKETMLKTIDEHGKLDAVLRNRIEKSWDAIELEDIYLAYKPKRRTRAEIAREQGLEVLAKILMKQDDIQPLQVAKRFLGKEVLCAENALHGAQDIIAEWVAENPAARQKLRTQFERSAQIKSKLIKGKEKEAEKYSNYFDFQEALKHSLPHRILALRRAHKEGFIRLSIVVDESDALRALNSRFVRSNNAASQLVQVAVKDAYKRLLAPSIENEFFKKSKEAADLKSIEVFSSNIKQLLLLPPLGQKRIMGIDPGFKSGCKVVCLDQQGELLHNENIYPHPPQKEATKAMRSLQKMVEAYQIEAIAIGNGTASRETEQLVAKTAFDRDLQVFVVSEDGASVYSASSVAREEFPSYDVTVRGAVSIARRLMDPLAELVKIDPKSIGVGQYQHDVDQSLLKNSLTQTVENVVNQVGVDVNTASYYLLTYISGLGPVLAKHIVDYRKENGAFSARKELLKVSKMGAKTYEQAAGFLRISAAKNPLDNSAVHPESYHVVEQMAKDLNCSLGDLMQSEELRKQIKIENYCTAQLGMPSLKDILQELERPARDPRDEIQVFQFDQSIRKLEDLREGMCLPGIVTNITNFGAFVDIGIKENGLLHLSQMAKRFISNPADVVSLHQQLEVKILSLDLKRKRIQLSLLIDD